MDFFEAQDRAKRNTGKLVTLYLLAVTGIICSVYVVSLLAFHSQVTGFDGADWWHPAWLLTVSLIVLAIITIGTLFRVSQLRKGGSAVAELLGGRRLDPSTTELNERRLMNIVEEMSIASGLPVPDVFILDNEENINAFAAGFGTQDAAVGITRGALEQLSRDELQGVIAHEFSHIFNGDMRLNIRLIGVLNGILLIHILGMIVMRSVMFSGGTRVRRSGGKNGGGNATIVIIIFGLSLVIIGYIGMVFGRMIQSAISRQREYLADAAAVQYTRNPDGLAGALNKIGLKKKGAEINDGHAMEMSHLFFASSFHSALDKLYSTHPPIEKRIRAISPSFGTGRDKSSSRIQKQFGKQHVSGPAPGVESKGVGGHAALTPEVILAAIGTLDSNHINRAGKLLREIPSGLKEAAHEPLGAEALAYALLFTSSESSAEEPPAWFANEAGQAMADETLRLLKKLSDAKREWYLPLAELALPSLRQMSREQYNSFRRVLRKCILDKQYESLFAFALEKMVLHQLDTAFSKTKKPDIRHHHFKTLHHELAVLLSALAYASKTTIETSFKAGVESIEKHLRQELTLLPQDRCGLKELDSALDELIASANPVKKYILSASIHTITADRKITIDEKELIRAISEALGSPIPLGAME